MNGSMNGLVKQYVFKQKQSNRLQFHILEIIVCADGTHNDRIENLMLFLT